jgi:AraC-like DNA-binding protein
LKQALRKEDFELVNDKERVLAEKIRYLIIEMIYYAEELPEVNYSDYISNKLHLSYTYLSRCFSKMKSIKIERFIITHKIERVKQLLLYNDMTLSEIAWKLRYSSTSHLSSQFKKVTGFTPSLFKKLKFKTFLSSRDL